MTPSHRRTATTHDPRSQPAYPLSEAAWYLKLANATLRSWVAGRSYPKAGGTGHFPPVIRPAESDPLTLSFWNLIEAHVLRALRTEHGVSLKDVRSAIRYAERSLKIERLLLSKALLTDAGHLFLDRYGELINLSASGQLAMRHLFLEHLKRVEWDERQFPIRLYPFLYLDSRGDDKPIAIDPDIAFGRPVLLRLGITTQAIVGRIDAGESIEEISKDYELTREEIEQAVIYERAA